MFEIDWNTRKDQQAKCRFRDQDDLYQESTNYRINNANGKHQNTCEDTMAGLHKLWYPGIRDTSTWSKFGAHGEHGDVFLFSNLGVLWFSENLIRYSLHVCLREVKTIFFPSNTLIYGISREGSKNFNIRTCEHMVLGQLRMGARQAKNAPLSTGIVFCCIGQTPSQILNIDLIKIANDLVEQTNTFQSLLIHIVFIIKLLKNIRWLINTIHFKRNDYEI